MAFSADNDKAQTRALRRFGDAEVASNFRIKNIVDYTVLSFPGQTPDRHTIVNLIGTTVPDNTDYPDSIAPIGSKYTRIIITSGAVSGALVYIKTAAATWTAQS